MRIIRIRRRGMFVSLSLEGRLRGEWADWLG